MREGSKTSIPIIKIILYVLIGILLLPLAIVLIPIALVVSLIGKRRKKKEERKPEIKFQDGRSIFHEKLSRLPSSYTPVSKLDDEFISRISEFTKLAFVSYNDYSGRGYVKLLDANAKLENKKRILEFLRENPIENLLNGERAGSETDLNHWYFIFYFDDPLLNRKIDGYGWTQDSMPFITKMTNYIPELLTESEKWEIKMREEVINRSFDAIKEDKIDK